MRNMEDTKTLKLRKPVTIVATTYTELELREPTAAEAEIFQKEVEKNGAMRGMMRLVQKIAGVPIEMVEKLGMRDMTEASQYLMGFMLPDPKTGEA